MIVVELNRKGRKEDKKRERTLKKDNIADLNKKSANQT